jgi:hypothetical protein
MGFSSLDDFLRIFLDASFLPMDPNDLLCMVWKWQHADVSRHAMRWRADLEGFGIEGVDSFR